MAIPLETNCMHLRLFLGSGDYYVFCRDCGAAWMRRGNSQRPEYGLLANGTPVGADPGEANKYTIEWHEDRRASPQGRNR